MPNISDVARKAGVSPVTVSRVLNNVGNVSPETRARVERAIEELGYVPNVAARSLRVKRTHTLALIVPDITNPFWTTVARGVEDAAAGRKYSILLYDTDEDPNKQRRYLDVITSQRVDGVIIAPYDSDARKLARLRQHQIPTVVIDRRIEGWEVDSVIGDTISGAYALTRHLVGLGHRRIVMLSGPAGASTADDRVAGYCLALSEAGLAVDQVLIRRGEFQAPSGLRMMRKILDQKVVFSAVFAANNALAMGAIDALEERGLEIPADIALVCFDDLPNASRFFPFLTVGVQPAYDMGMNAAQLLFSRLDAEVALQPRHVVLPTRLIIRYSCGSKGDGGGYMPRLPKLDEVQTESVLVRRIDIAQARRLSSCVEGLNIMPTRRPVNGGSDIEKPNIARLLKALRHKESDRVPHLEFRVTSKPVYEYVLERELKNEIVDARLGVHSVTPEDDVEFAQRLGMDAVVCHFSWRPNNVFNTAADGNEYYVDGSVRNWADLDDLQPPPLLTDQLGFLERYLRATQGTGVGVVANFTSFFDSALLAAGMQHSLTLFDNDRAFLERLMDLVLDHQAKVVRAVCDRFAGDLALVMVNDDIAQPAGLVIDPDLFESVFSRRMQRLIAPAKEHGKLVLMHTDGRVDGVMPLLYKIGIDALHPIQPECNDIFALKEAWTGRMALAGNIPASLLASGGKDEIVDTVREYCTRLGPGGGWVLSSSGRITEDIPPESLITMVRAAHKYGRYGLLGVES